MLPTHPSFDTQVTQTITKHLSTLYGYNIQGWLGWTRTQPFLTICILYCTTLWYIYNICHNIYLLIILCMQLVNPELSSMSIFHYPSLTPNMRQTIIIYAKYYYWWWEEESATWQHTPMFSQNPFQGDRYDCVVSIEQVIALKRLLRQHSTKDSNAHLSRWLNHFY
jgi:hypothetical protein